MGDYTMVSEAKARANAKNDKKTYTTIGARVRKDSGLKEKYLEYADSIDMQMSEFIIRSLNYIIDHQIKP